MLEEDSQKRSENEVRIAQQPRRIDPIVYDNPVKVTKYGSTENNSRIPLPIATIQNLHLGSQTFLPRSGYEILDGMPSVHIEQTFELNENLTSVTSENRYIVRSPLGEALFAATESSTERDRNMWGNARSFQMHIMDKTHQEALTLHRKFALGILCCQQRTIEVWSPPGNLIGAVLEEPSLFKSEFSIRRDGGEILYLIKALTNKGHCCWMPKEGHFEIVSPNDLETSKGSITRKWSSTLSQYTLNIYFKDINMDVKSKALFVGAGFLLEYSCFQSRA